MCTVDAAANGDAQAQLKYAFHEANREMLTEISEKAGYASLACLAAGCPQGAAAFGYIAMGAETSAWSDKWQFVPLRGEYPGKVCSP